MTTDGIRGRVSQLRSRDGRWLLLCLVLTYFIPVVLSSSNGFKDWNSPWVYPGVPWKMLPPFADLQVITAGYECSRQGYDVLVENPCDPTRWQRPMNYPRVWLLPARLGIDPSHTLVLGAALGALFLVAVFLNLGKVTNREALLFAAMLLSPAVMFGVERGNNDLVIFCVLSLTLWCLGNAKYWVRSAGYSLILFAAILKLYPIVALATYLKEGHRKIAVPLVLLGLFALYLFGTFESLALISRATPRATMASYGSRVVVDALASRLPGGPGLGAGGSMTIVVSSMSLVILLAYILARRTALTESTGSVDVQRIDSFRIGASIFVGTYALGNNWDYRLVFLLFTAPQVVRWASGGGPLARSSTFALVGMVVTLWWGGYSTDTALAHFEEPMNWLLLGYLVYAAILTLPDWLLRCLGLPATPAVARTTGP